MENYKKLMKFFCKYNIFKVKKNDIQNGVNGTKHKRFLSCLTAGLLFALVLMSFTFSLTVFSAEKKVMRVGWFQQPGYQETDENGKPFGYNYEYLMRIAQFTGWEYEFVNLNSFAECYDMLKNEKIDILGYILYSESREQEVAFPELSCGSVSTSLFVKKESPIQEYNFDDFNGISVACMESQNVVYLQEYAQDNNFSVDLDYYENMQAVMSAVLSGEADAGVNAGHQPGDTTRIVASFNPRPFYFALKKSDSDSFARMNSALTSISLETPFYDRELAYKYLPQIKSTLNLTDAEKRYIEENPVIEVSYYPNWFPISFKDAETEQFSGITRDVFERISQITGLSFTYTPVVRGTQEAEEAKVLAGIVHNYANAYESSQRITTGYLNIPLVLARREGFENHESKTTALSSHLLDLVECTSIEDTQLITYVTIQQSLDAVENGEADQALINAFACEYLLRQARYKKLESLMLYNESYNICIGVKNDIEPELCSIFNKSLDMISQADMNGIIYKNTSRSMEINLSNIIAQMPTDVILLAGAILITLILLMAVIIFRQRKYSSKIKSILYTDELTGALSFKGFLSQAEQSISKNIDSKAFIVDFDINHFGAFNNINGYAQGNQLLRTVANVTRRLCNENELYGRIQADHFVGLVFDKDAQAFKERAVTGLEHFRKESGRSALLISYGIYEIVDRKMSIVDMCDRALAAKNTIKGSYERFVAIYDEELHSKEIHNVAILDSFESAMQAGEFVHYFQPKVDANTCAIVGAEALVRWVRPNQEVIMPGQFIELFERNGLIAKLDLHMFEKLCGRMEDLMRQGAELLPVSVNFSRVHLYDNGFAERLIRIVRRYNIPASLLEIEITETAFADNWKGMTRMLDMLHEAGFLISIDDFGSGFSSLNVLKDMDFDIIKLDRIFLDTIGNSDKSETVITSIISLARKLKLITVAEGVETLSQYEMLKNCGCDMVQGYYFAKPMPEDEYLKLTNKSL